MEVFHIHCHFDEASEVAAATALAGVRAAIEAAAERTAPGGGAGFRERSEGVLHEWWWKGKNGPHECWSWEVWVESQAALGAALDALMGAGPGGGEAGSDGGEQRLFFCFHADTDQESTDHGARLAWVGSCDPKPLDHGFFKDPPASYCGPAARRARRSDARDLFSMGALWPRGEDGSLRAGVYGAVLRAKEEGGPGAEAPATAGREMPVLFLPHGAPPVPIEPCLSSDFLRAAAARLPGPPSAIVFMSPHFMSGEGGGDAGVFRLSTCPWPSTIYDFDDDTDPTALEKLCKLKYPCPGDPALAQLAGEFLEAAGFDVEFDSERGLDHGAWTPLYEMFPGAGVPVVSISVRGDLSAEAHLGAGRALAPLRSQGVLLLGSGEVVHNVPEMGPRASPPQPWCLEFEGWAEAAMATGGAGAALAGWKDAPGAAKSHPEGSPGEHLMPLLFTAGAGGVDPGRPVHKEYLGSLPMGAYAWGSFA